MTSKHILVIYPELHKTKVAVYRNVEPVFLKNISHSREDLAKFKNAFEQKDFRMDCIRDELERNYFPLDEMQIIMGRSGLVKPVSQGIHVTNLGALMAHEFAQETGVEAYIANPVVVDELSDVARITGHPLFTRKSIFHALNHKHVAYKYAKAINRKYEEMNLIVCHVGRGGVSIGAHQNGRVVDVNQAYDGDGPFGVTRSGSLPMGDLVRMCFSGKHSEDEIMDMITTKGGYTAYLGTDNIPEINQMLADGNETAHKVSYALSYQVSKEIASHVATLEGKVDAIILTGVIFDSSRFLENVKQRIGSIAPIGLYPSVNDVEALAMFGVRVLKQEVKVKEYL